jgi:hypothetical protein
MKTPRSLLVAAVALAMIPALARSQSAPATIDTSKVDVTGKWNFNLESPVQATPTVTFTQKGDSISGQYVSNAMGTKPFVGTVKGRVVTFSFGAESGGQSFTMAFTGKIEDPDTMSGTIDFSGFAQGTFSAKRAKP